MHEMLTLDLGPDFYGFLKNSWENRVCCDAWVERDAPARAVSDLIKRQGGDCAACKACIIGQHT
ncbi:hypothetical protein STENM36S_03536 [Streptomyces tendae]